MNCSPPDTRLLWSWISRGKNMECVAIAFSRGSSRLRDWTPDSRIAGRFFTSWATREALNLLLFSRVPLFATPWTAARQASCPPPSPGACSNLPPLSQPCHPTMSSFVLPFSSRPQSFPASGLFRWVSSSYQVAKVLELQFQHQSSQWMFRVDFLFLICIFKMYLLWTMSGFCFSHACWECLPLLPLVTVFSEFGWPGNDLCTAACLLW